MNVKNEPGAEPAIAQDATYHRAPDALRDRVRATLAANSREEGRSGRWRLFGFAAAFATVALVSWNVALLVARPGPDESFERDAVSAHVRSLMVPGHWSDVVSTDQHTVKPWFTGKLDFAPPVGDYAASGFSLEGGRLDYLDGRPVAALAYRHRLHAVNLFVWPAQGAADSAPRAVARQGYAIVRWTRGGMNFCAVADVAPSDLAALADLVRPAG